MDLNLTRILKIENFQSRPDATATILDSVVTSLTTPRTPANRKAFPIMELATLSGMGKSTIAWHAVDDMVAAARRGGTDKKIVSALEHAVEVHVDFNSGGDAMQPEELKDEIAIAAAFGVRLAARGLFNMPYSTAQQLSAFAKNRSVWTVDKVIRKLWNMHRLRLGLAKDAPLLLFIHVDEFQLALSGCNLAVPQVTALMKGWFLSVIHSNMNVLPDTEAGCVALLITGTVTAGITFSVTEPRVLRVPMRAFTYNQAFDFLKLRSPCHESWIHQDDFIRLVLDLGGVPMLLDYLAREIKSNAAMQLSCENHSDPTKIILSIGREIQKQVEIRYSIWQLSGLVGDASGVLKLLSIVLGQRSFPDTTPIGDTSVKTLARIGFLMTLPDPTHEPAHGPDGLIVTWVFVSCPVPVLHGLIQKHLNDLPAHLSDFLRFPFVAGVAGSKGLECVMALAVAARLSSPTSTTIRNLLSVPVNKDLYGYAVDVTLDARLTPQAGRVCQVMIEQKQFVIGNKTTGDRVQNTLATQAAPLFGTPSYVTVNVDPTNPTFFIHATGSMGADGRVALAANPNPILAEFEAKIGQITVNEVREHTHRNLAALDKCADLSARFDYVLIIVALECVSKHSAQKSRQAKSRELAARLATPPGANATDPRVIVLMGDDVKQLLLPLFHRIPDTDVLDSLGESSSSSSSSSSSGASFSLSASRSSSSM